MKYNFYAELPEHYLKETLKYEGGYVNNPLDKGGPTSHGVTQGALDRAKTQGLVPQFVTIESLTDDLISVRKIYDANYYKAGKCPQMPDPLSFAHFDACVHSGTGGRNKAGVAIGAGALLQKAIISLGENIQLDGAVGTLTLAAMNKVLDKYGLKKLVVMYNDKRENYFTAIVASNPSQRVFLNGWMRRVNSVRQFVEKYL